MANVNKAIIIGTVGQDVEVRYTPSGAAVCNLRVATNRSWKDKQSGEKKEEVEWHAIVLYDRQAEVAGEYLKKGKPVYIEGRLKTRKWQDKDGSDRYTTEIVSENMQLLGGREEGQERRESAPRAPAKPAPRSAPPRPAPKTGTGFDEMDEDLPF